MQTNPLDQIQSRYILLLLVVSLLVMPFVVFMWVIPTSFEQEAPSYFTQESLLFAGIYLFMAAVLWWGADAQQRDELLSLVHPERNTVDAKKYLLLSMGMILSAFGFIYLLFYPLSFVAPDFVQSYLLDVPPVLFWEEGNTYWLGNLVALFAAIILAPIVEEIVFRGYLLNRWTHKFGALPAVILSSLLFAVLHPDILGAFVFAVFMCLIYMRTGSLLAVIVVHMGNNALAMLIQYLDLAYLTGFVAPTISDFHDWLWLGVVGGAIGFPWLWWFYQRELQPARDLLQTHEQGDERASLS